MSNKNLHGGDLDEISRIYNINKDSIINFSGNVNPLGLPESVKNAILNNLNICTNYPDVAYVKLRKSISEYTGVDYDNIIVGNGSTELISGFIKYVNPKKAVIISPAYSEYLKEIDAVGGKTDLYELKESDNFKLDIDGLISKLTDETDLLVICNPNNPTGSYITETEIEYILNFCKNNSIKVMIDETYVEFSNLNIKVSAMSLISKYENLFIIRGTSKFFACPGLRLGYGACSNQNTLDFINQNKDLWSVNVFAELAGQVMFVDKDFINKTTELINSERNRIIDEFENYNNLKLYDTQSNFFLAKILKHNFTAADLFNSLIKKGILIRNCDNFPFLSNKFIRFCILNKNHNTMLIENIKSILN